VSSEVSSAILWLLHDGELADVRAIGEAAGARVVETRSMDAPAEWDVLVATGRFAHGEHLKRAGDAKCVRIAVLDRNTRSLRHLVRRSGFDLVVRRPVHPTVLRLLVLHALYRGPERRSRRVPIGVAVRFRAGLFRRDGVLADLSLRGCQIVTKHVPRAGSSVVVWVPESSPSQRPLAMRGSVIRVLAGAERGFGVDFGRVSKEDATRLRAAMQLYAEGPAANANAPIADPGATHPIVSPAPVDTPPALDPNETTASGYRAGGNGRRDVVRVPDAFASRLEGAPRDADSADRRIGERHAYGGRRVVALGDEAARVLIGRDLSVGGMRVEATDGIVVGQRFRIALHVAPGQTPLVVQAESLRDDGEHGIAIRFLDVDETAARYLTKMVDSLPVIGATGGVVVSEIVGDLLPPRAD
jgi:hypothetical protein